MSEFFRYNRIEIEQERQEIRRECGKLRDLTDLLRRVAQSSSSIVLTPIFHELIHRSERLREEMDRTEHALGEYEDGAESDLRRIESNYEDAIRRARDIFS